MNARLKVPADVVRNWYKPFDRDCFVEEYPELEAYVERIATIPAVTGYIRHHQEATTWIPIPEMGLALTTPEETEGLTSVR